MPLRQGALSTSRAAVATRAAAAPWRSLNTAPLAARAPAPAAVAPRIAQRFTSTNTPGAIATAATSDFDPHAVTAMDKQVPPEPGSDFNVVIIGAGNINFGSDEGPWNHSFRLEHKLGPRLKVVALIDPSAERAKQVLHTKCKSFVLSAYKDTIVYPSFEEYVRNYDRSKPPHAIWVGSPPAFRGREESGRDLEKALIEAFPNTGIFIEKPVSTGPVSQAFEIAERLKKAGNIVSVGYMLRYLKVVQKMKQILEENNLKVMATNARYIMA